MQRHNPILIALGTVLTSFTLELSMTTSGQKLLVYIPAYSDFESTIYQSERLKSEFLSSNIQLKIAISVNAVALKPTEHEKLLSACDVFMYTPENLGGDSNINLGYLSALNEGADYFWILSANDLLKEGSVRLIVERLEKLDSDLLIISPSTRTSVGNIENVLLGISTQLPIGLISAVIYKVPRFRESFASAMKFAWTGWGQLSVLQNAIFENGSLRYETINDDLIYERQIDKNQQNEFARSQSHYRHSFFGYPLLAALLFGHDRKIRNKIIRVWLNANWYKIGFFKRGHSPYAVSGESARDVFWTGPLSTRFILQSGIFSPLFYFAGQIIPFHLLLRSEIFMKILKWVRGRKHD